MNDAARQPHHSPWAWAVLAVVTFAIAAAAVVFLVGGGDSGEAAPPTPAVASAPGASSPAAPEASPDANAALSQIRRQSGEPLLDGGRPSVFFMGAEWCPFCASERWALVEATSRFGSWKGLGELSSRPGQGNYPSLPTYDLTGATYTSDYLSLRHVEVADVDGDDLQEVGDFEAELVNDYDKAGAIPFLFAGGAGGRYTVELAYSPSVLEGQSFAALREDVSEGAETPAVEAIDGEADAITALLCRQTGQRPVSACERPAVEALEQGLE